MRRVFTAQESGLTRATLRWGEGQGKWRRADRGVYLEGGEAPNAVDRARARVLAARTVARGTLAGILHDLDSVPFDGRPTREHDPPWLRISTLGGVPCADGLTTLLDLAAVMSDETWEHALEAALRKRLTTIEAIEAVLPVLSRGRIPGVARIRRVLALRPPGAPATESLLETLMVQLIRLIPGLQPPTRQYRVVNAYGEVIARVDLCWPDLGVFLELDGQHHPGQPKHDAVRQTAVSAAMGWLVGRFTWDEVVRNPTVTARRLAALVEQARRRPMQQPA